ncbi:MAG: prenyltransferase/squalene oxidase repeat-containing protein, partial [Planctomycetia bacterium]
LPPPKSAKAAAVPATTAGGPALAALSPAVTTPPTGGGAASMTNRTAPDRGRVLEALGGSPRTEQAVADALKWLAEHQETQGFWDSDGFFSRCPAGDGCTGPAVEVDSDNGLTGLAVLAFLGAGHTQKVDGPYREVVQRGLDWLLKSQEVDGDLQRGGRIYSHAIATMAVCEALAMTNDERLRKPAQRAIDYLVRAQHPESGGWRYAPGQYGDTSVYGWVLLALRSGQGAGLRVPPQTWALARRWLDLVCSGPHQAYASYTPGLPVSHAMTAEALVCRQVLGAKRTDPALDAAGDHLLSRPPDAGDYHLYYWYYGSLGMFHLGGPHWQRWNDRLTATLLDAQEKTSHRKGSWEPRRPFGVDGGRVFTTAAGALCLEVYYRYLPLYAADP